MNEPKLDPFEYLGNEHAELERVFQFFEGVLAEADSDPERARAGLEAVIDYLTLVGDLGHHDKEESLLTPVLVAHGFDWYDGPVATMRREHRQERYLVRVLTEIASQRGPWSREDVRRLRDVGTEFIRFMRHHMDLENREILAPARSSIPPAVQDQLLSELQRFDAEHASATHSDEVRDRMEKLLVRK
jgi:hemerythrin-like domain-containing protein